MNAEALYPNIQDNEPLSEEVSLMKGMVINALRKTYKDHLELGAKGLEYFGQENRYGDLTLLADWVAEQSILDYLRKQKIGIRLIGEEIEDTDLGQEIDYLGVADGIDGTSAYKKGLEYSTLFSILKGVSPYYKDYLASGILMYPTGGLMLATRDNGAFLLLDGKVDPVHVSDYQKLNKEATRIATDDYFEVTQRVFVANFSSFKNFEVLTPESPGSSGLLYARLACGELDLVLECTRKENQEIVVAYGTVKEAGGVMLDIEGNDLGDKKYLEFGKEGGRATPIISANSIDLAHEAIEYIRSRLKKA